MEEITLEKKTLEHSCTGNEHHCTLTDRGTMCEPLSLISGTVLFIKEPKHPPCSCCFSFGEGYVCHCPARKEIYKKYRI